MLYKQAFIHIITIIILISGCTSPQDTKKSTTGKILLNIDGEPVVPREANNIFISLFLNRTGNDILSEKLRLKINETISMDGRLAVVSDEADADLRLEGIITKYQIQPIEFGELRQPIKKRMRITVTVRLINIKENKLIFYETGLQSFKTYSDLIPPIKTEIQVLEEVIENLSNRISSKIITGWYTDYMTNIEKGKK